MLEFILARYNYWIVICLMMTGLYIVFSRGHLVKVLMGLNLFQTSVFIFYITVGKVMGGTAPILIEDKAKKSAGHASDEHAGAPVADPSTNHHSADETSMALAEAGKGHLDAHADGHGESLSEAPTGMINEATGTQLRSRADAQALVDQGAVHPGDVGDHVSEPAPGVAQHLDASPITPYTLVPHPEDAASLPLAAQNLVGSEYYGEVLYSNPLPHVLILTAIVVGVATTAVGLALSVRIREAYGTVEQDELEMMDNAEEAVEAGT